MRMRVRVSPDRKEEITKIVFDTRSKAIVSGLLKMEARGGELYKGVICKIWAML
ncbi:MAG TPA: hypothetical protein VNG71_22140 [Pyrinomonadaceae bacterium]|nr:hypothetical protein [Pyrinomonadaceae bacterium]